MQYLIYSAFPPSTIWKSDHIQIELHVYKFTQLVKDCQGYLLYVAACNGWRKNNVRFYNNEK